MKNILVYAAALRMGGAVTIYNQFIDHLKTEIGDNKYFIFVNGVLNQPDIHGVRYCVVDIASRKNRIEFEKKNCIEILKKEDFVPDLVISLQNTGLKCLSSIPHIIYYHQSLPFFTHKWNPFKSAERKLFVYKYFYLFFVKCSLGKNVKFVVQTKFIKDNLVRRLHLDPENVYVCFPDVDIPEITSVLEYPFPEDKFNIIYPSLYSPHKAHDIIVRTLSLMKLKNPDLLMRVKVYFTISEKESLSLASMIRNNNLQENICFLGKQPYSTVLSLYNSAHLMLFPSTMETIGLPLIEAASFGLPIIVSDLPYAREVLEDYQGALFVRAQNPLDWLNAIESIIEKNKFSYPSLTNVNKYGWKEFFKLV